VRCRTVKIKADIAVEVGFTKNPLPNGSSKAAGVADTENLG